MSGCEGSYDLIRGPKGDKGSLGQQGIPGTSAGSGPTGFDGYPGRTKIDISLDTKDGYSLVSGNALETTRSTAETIDTAFSDPFTVQKTIPSTGYDAIATFIYPGETVWGGHLQRLSILMATEEVTSNGYAQALEQFGIQVFYYEDSGSGMVFKELTHKIIERATYPDIFTDDKTAPKIIDIVFNYSGNIGQQLIYVKFPKGDIKGNDLYIYSLEAY